MTNVTCSKSGEELWDEFKTSYNSMLKNIDKDTFAILMKYERISTDGDGDCLYTTTGHWDDYERCELFLKHPTHKKFEKALLKFEKEVQEIENDPIEGMDMPNRYIITNNNNDIGFLASIQPCYDFSPWPPIDEGDDSEQT